MKMMVIPIVIDMFGTLSKGLEIGERIETT